MTKPSVAILHYSCPPVIGGVEFIIEAHAREFAKAGYRTRLIVGKGQCADGKVSTVVIPEISSTGGPVSSVLKALDRGEVPRSFANAVKRVERRLTAALRGFDVCMIHNVMTMHFNLVLTAALANISKRSRSTRFIAWTHDLTFADPIYEPHQHRRYPWSLLLQPVPGCDYCCISTQRQKEMKRFFRVPVATLPVIPDGINVPELLRLTPRAQQIFRDEGLSGVDIVAMTPSRILRRKNLGVGMEIVASLKRMKKSVRWFITGAPDPHNAESVKYYKMLQSLRRQLKVTKEVVFLSERFGESVSREDLLAMYRLSDMLLFPSDREGFGLPVLEAGLAGLLVVVSNIQALRELAGRHAVYIHLGDSSDAVAKNVVKAMKNRPELRYRKEVISTYSWEIVFEKHIVPAIIKPTKVWKQPPKA